MGNRATSRLMVGFLAASMAVSVLLGAAGPVRAQAPGTPTDFTAVVRQRMPAVVAILTRQQIEQQAQAPSDHTTLEDLLRRRFGGQQGEGEDDAQPRMALGSGFVISRDGYIVTNNHVVESAAEIHVRLMNKTDLTARLVGRDPSTDIAVLKIEPPTELAVAPWGDSDRMEPGAWTIAIGSPFGLGGTVTVGVLSARSRDIHSGPYDDYLQTDAAINRGNSGGPLFNAAGEVIGVNTAIFSPSGGSVGIGFAVPSRTAQAIAEQIIRTGRVERGFVGLRLQEITPAIAQALGQPDDKGALVAGVERGGPAEKAGITTGDIIIALNGAPIESGRALSRAVAGLRPGTQATMTVVRDGKTREISVAIGQRQDERAVQTGALDQPDGGKRLGLALTPMSDSARRRLGVGADVSGLLVQRVDPNSPAAESGLRAGDVIVSANNHPVNAPADVAQAWSEAQKHKRPVLLGVRRGDQSLFVAIAG